MLNFLRLLYKLDYTIVILRIFEEKIQIVELIYTDIQNYSNICKKLSLLSKSYPNIIYKYNLLR